MAESLKAKIDYLIVGQGLAGSLLAWRLIEQGKSVLIVDPALAQSASRTAAGLINPVTGKRLVKTVGVENYLPEAKKLYQEFAGFFGEVFFHEKQQVRIFKSEDEKRQWKKRKNQADYAPFLAEQFAAGEEDCLGDDAMGGFEQKQCGYLDTVLLLDKLRSFFKEQGCFRQSTLEVDELKTVGPTVEWRDGRFGKVIFCEGYHLQNNRWFSWLPLQPAQGEILTLKSAEVLPKKVVQFGKWLLPLSNGRYKIGATWQWKPLDEKVNKQAVEGLVESCNRQFPYLKFSQLLETKVGVRPGTRDKLPFLGSHPHHANLVVFNGFGSKGSLMIPWYSECLSRHLIKGDNLPEQVDIKRYEDGCPAG